MVQIESIPENTQKLVISLGSFARRLDSSYIYEPSINTLLCKANEVPNRDSHPLGAVKTNWEGPRLEIPEKDVSIRLKPRSLLAFAVAVAGVLRLAVLAARVTF